MALKTNTIVYQRHNSSNPLLPRSRPQPLELPFVLLRPMQPSNAFEQRSVGAWNHSLGLTLKCASDLLCAHSPPPDGIPGHYIRTTFGGSVSPRYPRCRKTCRNLTLPSVAVNFTRHMARVVVRGTIRSWSMLTRSCYLKSM